LLLPDVPLNIPPIITSDIRALSSLNLATNGLYAEGTKLLAEVLKGNTIMTELNISDNSATWDGKKHGEMSGITALADAIPDMGALTSLNLASNYLCGLDEDGDGTFDASGDACVHHHTQLTCACLHRHYRPCQCNP
jgi:hypothetical protein